VSEPLELRVVSGVPDDAELAAVVAVLLASASRRARPGEDGRRSLWGHPATLVRLPRAPQPGGWASPRP
jgi:hypothetical protein